MPYKVLFVDLPKQFQALEGELSPVMQDVLFKRADFIMRDDLKEFEEKFAGMLGVKYAVGLNSGTDALLLSLRTAGIGPGDEVITVAHTFVATVAAIVHCGATPVLVDVKREDHVMDVEKAAQAVTRKTKAVIPVHLNGRMCMMDKIMDLARKNNLAVIEDAAQAILASYNGKRGGSYGQTGCFSLYPMKILGGAGDGGVMITDKEEVAQKIRFLRDHGQNRQTGEVIGYGVNSRLDNVHAAVLNIKLKHLPGWIDRRTELAKLYHKGLSELSPDHLRLPPAPYENSTQRDSWQNYVIRARERDKLVNCLEENGVEVLVSWRIPMHHQKALGLGHFRLPETEALSLEVISLPLNTEITNEQVEYVVDRIKAFYKKH